MNGMIDLSFRPATPEDADILVDLVLMAGEGLAVMAWTRLAGPGKTVRDIGRQRALREQGGFTYRNATLAIRHGEVIGGMIGYPLPDQPVPIGPQVPAEFVPLQELENRVPGTWYLNVLGLYPPFRNLGFGARMLDHAQATARALGRDGVSVIVFVANPGAERLYRRSGFVEVARKKVEVPGWRHSGTEAILLLRPT